MDHPSMPRAVPLASVQRRKLLLVSAFGLAGVAFAQTIARRVRIAFLSGGTPDVGGQRNMIDPFVQGLRDLGYIDGQNTTIDWRWAEGRTERLPALLAELLRLEPDVLVAVGPRPAELAKNLGPVVPVVALAVNNPVLDGLAASLARPGGHITGISSWGIELVAKRLQLFKELVPGARRVAVLSNPVTAPDNRPLVRTGYGYHGPAVVVAQCRRGAAVRRRSLVLGGCGLTLARRARAQSAGRMRRIGVLRSGRYAGGACRRALGPLCRSHPQERQSRRSADRAAEEVRVGHQHADGQGARPDNHANPVIAG